MKTNFRKRLRLFVRKIANTLNDELPNNPNYHEDEAVEEIISLIESELIPKEDAPINTPDSYEWSEGYNTLIKEIRAKLK